MDESIAKLKLGTFCGRRVTRRQLAEVKRTVELFPALSRKELARTVCEHLDWRAGSGEDSVVYGLEAARDARVAGCSGAAGEAA